MNLTTNDLLIVIGEQTLTIKAQGMQIDSMLKRLKELEPSAPPVLKEVNKGD